MDNSTDSNAPQNSAEETHAASASDDSDAFEESAATVLTPTSTLKAKELPAGMTPRELAHALQGEMLNQFQLQEFVGGGGMGVVFKALDTTLGRTVAVKVVASQTISAEAIQRRFLVEAQSAARLDHPNIARVYDTGRSRGLPYIVLEFVEGANVRDLVINHGPLPLGDALSYSYQIAHALAHAWERDVVHRDIKPSNILINSERQAKLVDMGLARLNEVEPSEADLTNTGVTLGTFDYISPEQARDPRAADVRSDIYSLGCTLFYMLAGHPPYSQGTAAQKLLQHQDGRPPELLSFRPDVSAGVDNLLQSMLAKNPDDRPQTPTELVGALAELLHAEGLQEPQALAPLPMLRPARRESAWRRHVPWAVPAVVLLAVWVWMSTSPVKSTTDSPFPPLQRISEPQETAPASADISTTETANPQEESTTKDKQTTAPNDLSATESPHEIDATIDVGPLLDNITVEPEPDNVDPEAETELQDKSSQFELPVFQVKESPLPVRLELQKTEE